MCQWLWAGWNTNVPTSEHETSVIWVVPLGDGGPRWVYISWNAFVVPVAASFSPRSSSGPSPTLPNGVREEQPPRGRPFDPRYESDSPRRLCDNVRIVGVASRKGRRRRLEGNRKEGGDGH
jgi:hypothetical protein